LSAFAAGAASEVGDGGGGADVKDGGEELGLVAQEGSLQVGQSSGRRAMQAASGVARAISEKSESFMARLLRMLAKAIREPMAIRLQIRARLFQASPA
jgi:hypothetical protein